MKLVALDMDGTLLNSSSSIPPAAASAIRAACSRGVRVIIATGKARPGALAAVRAAGLEGDDLLLSLQTPGVFLQVGEGCVGTHWVLSTAQGLVLCCKQQYVWRPLHVDLISKRQTVFGTCNASAAAPVDAHDVGWCSVAEV